MKLNGAQGTYHSVPQNAQAEEVESPKKAPSEESVIENGPKTQSPSKEQPEDSNPEDEKKPMSPLRKFCFVLSLLQCVLFIVAFGWLIPCKIPRHTDPGQFSHNWEYHFYGEDVVTNLALSSQSHKPVVLTFGYTTVNNGSVSGVRALNVFDGSVLWDQHTVGLPESIVCNGIDITNDKVPDCIITDNAGQMIAVDIRNGQIVWSMHDHHANSTVQPQQISSAIVGEKCDGQTLPFIYAAVKDITGLFFFITVSGETGQIQEIYNLTECATLPENFMFREVTDEDEKAALELVMSCANKEGNGIVYTTSVDKFCDNKTFQSFNSISFKLAFTDSEEYPMSLKTIIAEDKGNLVGLTHNGKIKIFSDNPPQNRYLLSSTDTMNLKHFSIGRFTNNSMANIAISGDTISGNSSTILLLDSTNANPVWSIPLENGTITSMYTIQKAFNSLDAILLKIISKVNDDEIELLNTTDRSPDIEHFEERYAILECSETRALKTVSSEYLLENCAKSDCYSKVFNNKQTAMVADVDQDESDELVFFTRKSFLNSVDMSITLRLVRLSEFIPSKSCSSPCHC